MSSLDEMSSALEQLMGVTVDPFPTGNRGRLATNLATRCLRQTLLAMAEALEPSDFQESITRIRISIARRAWKVITTLGPLVIDTLPDEE